MVDHFAPPYGYDFINNFSHEFKTPIVSLSTNVFYLSKLEKQAILLDRKCFNLSEQIRLVLALLGRKFTDKNLEPEFTGKEIWCEGNEEMLKQVWINLLDNAIKFSPPGKKIEVYVTDSSGEISVKIRDFGNGINPEQKKRIFAMNSMLQQGMVLASLL